jgi:hypothetical protein
MEKLFKTTTQENKLEKPKIKEGVDFVFEQNSEYLDTIFPDSKVKGIVYHQTPREFEEFDFTKSRTPGVYFSPYNKKVPKLVNLIVLGKFSSNTKMTIVNIINPFFAKESKYERGVNDVSILSKKVDLKEYDGVIGYANAMYYKGEFEKGYIDTSIDKSDSQIIVFEPEQIHILGSKKDVESFKEFTKNNEDHL